MGGPNSASNQGRWPGMDMWGLLADGKQSVQVGVVPNSQDRGTLSIVGRGAAFTKLDLKHAYQQLASAR